MPAPAWLDEHLLGFAAEAQSGSEEDDARRRDDIERALGHYKSALTIRPGSFWSHYRAATACFNLGRESEATDHLTQCVQLRPRNAEVQVQLAGRLFAIGQYPLAMEHCDRAMERAPRLAELYRTRAFARAMARQPAGVDEDLQNFEMFSRVLPPSLWGGRRSVDPLARAGLLGSAFAGPSAVDQPPLESNPEELAARARLAEVLRKAELFPQARAELDKILLIRPDHIPSRIWRGSQKIEDGRFDEARSDLRVALGHPGLDEHVRAYPDTFDSLFRIIRQYLNAGRVEDARWVAGHTWDLAVSIRREVGRADYASAQVYAVLGRSNGEAIDRAARHLFRAFVAHADFQTWYRNKNPWFDPVRTEIDAVLGRMEDPAAIRGRRLAQSSARPKAASP
jgi:tetratricopeptide (TPR) repeat protein